MATELIPHRGRCQAGIENFDRLWLAKLDLPDLPSSEYQRIYEHLHEPVGKLRDAIRTAVDVSFDYFMKFLFTFSFYFRLILWTSLSTIFGLSVSHGTRCQKSTWCSTEQCTASSCRSSKMDSATALGSERFAATVSTILKKNYHYPLL